MTRIWTHPRSGKRYAIDLHDDEYVERHERWVASMGRVADKINRWKNPEPTVAETEGSAVLIPRNMR